MSNPTDAEILALARRHLDVGLCFDSTARITRATDAELITFARAALAAQQPADLDAYKRAAPLCNKHQPDGGTRSVCLVCACQKLSAALSRISYLCVEPNEMECGPYDVHCDEGAVVEQVEALVTKIAAAPAVQPELTGEDTAEHVAYRRGFQHGGDMARAAAQQPARGREADRARFPDPAFNEWLDTTVTENGEFTVWHLLASTGDALAGWENRPHYVKEQPAPFSRPQEDGLQPNTWANVLLLVNEYAGHVVDASLHQAESRADIARSAALKTLGKLHQAFEARRDPSAQPSILSALDYSASRGIAVTKEWCRGWDDCRALVASAAPSAQPVAVPAEPLVRFCPGCGSVGEVGPEFRDCCPDGSHARMVPESLAHRCHDLFQLALCAPSDPDEVLAAAPSAPSAQPVAVFHAHPEDWQYSITLLPGVPMLRNGTLLAAAPSATQQKGDAA